MKIMNFMAEENRLEKLTQLGDQLEKLNNIIDWNLFAEPIKAVFAKEKKGAGGRPPYDYVMMFKILVLQRLYNISDDQTEYQINDRMSFMRFLGLSMSEKVPDAKTIWHFRNELVKAEVIDFLFGLFTQTLEVNGVITHEGSIVDASFVDAPKQRNSRKENEQIKEGIVPEDWSENKLRQKDMDAKWAKKGNEVHYGYKDHIKVDADSKIILDYEVTSAEVHDSKVFEGFLDVIDKAIYADSAYVGREIPDHIEAHIFEKGYRNHPLSEEQKESNRRKSKIRCRVEHVFGHIHGAMKGITLRCKGLARAKFNIGLTNLIYNMARYAFIQSQTCIA